MELLGAPTVSLQISDEHIVFELIVIEDRQTFSPLSSIDNALGIHDSLSSTDYYNYLRAGLLFEYTNSDALIAINR
eukprot:UN17273